MTRPCFAIALACVLSAGSSARAVVEAEMPLAQLVKDSQLIAVMTLEQVDRGGGKGLLKLERVLQGDEPAAAIPIKLVAPAGGEGSPDDMLDRVGDGTKLIVFLSSLAPDNHQVIAYSSGSWFKFRGVGELNQLKLVFLQGEPYLRRTFHGDDAELVKLLADFAAGKGTLPELDKSAEPGLGPRLNEASPAPQSVAIAPDQIALGPAWQIDGEEKPAAPQDPSGALVMAILLAAAVGLVLMMTRSSPGAAA